MRLLSLFLCIGLFSSLVNAAYQNISWQNPSPTGDDIYNVTGYPNTSQYLLVGENGALATASDAVSWVFQTTNTNETLRGCTIGVGVMLAVGDNGTILRSTDGTTWTQVTGQTANFRDVVYGAGTYLAIGESGGSAYAISSTDGLSWTTRNTGLSDPLNSVAYLGTTYVVVGDKGAVAYSLNALNWNTVESISEQNLVSVAAGEGQFIAMGNATEGARIFVSQTGQSWSSRSAPSSADGLSFNGVGYYSSNYTITANEGKILTSTDATTWTIREIVEGYSGDYLANYGNAGTGSNVVGRGGAIYRSLNGLIDWTQYAQGAQGTYNAIVQGGGYTVTVGDSGKIGATPNSEAWNNRTSNSTSNLNAVTYGNNTWVAAGEGGTILITSFEADNWATRSTSVTAELYSALYGNGRFIVGGQNGVLLSSTSQGATTWSTLTSVTNEDIIELAYLNSIFLGGTDEGSIIFSTNGTAWSLFPNVMPGRIYGFAWFDDKYWAVSQDSGTSYLYSSPDGTSWAKVSEQSNTELNTLAASDYWLVATAIDGDVLSSNDGVNWDFESEVLSPGMQAVIYSSGSFVAAGKYSKVADIDIGIAFDVYFTGLVDKGNGWWKSSWLGYFNGLNYPFIYHEYQGFWFCSGQGMEDGANSYWFYDYQLGWIWTGEGPYPWMYVSARGTWAYYDSNINGVRWFYFQDTGLWQAIPIS